MYSCSCTYNTSPNTWLYLIPCHLIVMLNPFKSVTLSVLCQFAFVHVKKNWWHACSWGRPSHNLFLVPACVGDQSCVFQLGLSSKRNVILFPLLHSEPASVFLPIFIFVELWGDNARSNLPGLFCCCCFGCFFVLNYYYYYVLNY